MINGSVSSGFDAVRAAFLDGFESGREVGAALTVINQGEVVVDLSGGFTDRKKTQPWMPDTLVCCFSISKAISALCLLRGVDAGLLDLDSPVAQYWPEFAQHGKDRVTVREVMSHQAGVPGFHESADRGLYYDWDATCTRLAAERPWWEPGTAHGYHARTLGFLFGELLRRTSDKTIDVWLEDIASPNELDVYFGLKDHDLERCADMLPAKIRPGEEKNWTEAMQRMAADFLDPSTVTGATFQNPSMRPGYMNTSEFRQAVIPALNGHATSLGIASLLSMLPQLLSPDLLAEAARTQAVGPDQALKSRTRFGLGFMLYEDESPIGWPGCMGHAGAGGSVAFYDPDKEVSFAFVMNQMQEGVVTGGTTALNCVQALQNIVA